MKKGATMVVVPFLGGVTEIRTRDTLLTYTRFPGVPLQPLEHHSNRQMRGKGNTIWRKTTTKRTFFVIFVAWNTMGD